MVRSAQLGIDESIVTLILLLSWDSLLVLPSQEFQKVPAKRMCLLHSRWARDPGRCGVAVGPHHGGCRTGRQPRAQLQISEGAMSHSGCKATSTRAPSPLLIWGHMDETGVKRDMRREASKEGPSPGFVHGCSQQGVVGGCCWPLCLIWVSRVILRVEWPHTHPWPSQEPGLTWASPLAQSGYFLSWGMQGVKFQQQPFKKKNTSNDTAANLFYQVKMQSIRWSLAFHNK